MHRFWQWLIRTILIWMKDKCIDNIVTYVYILFFVLRWKSPREYRWYLRQYCFCRCDQKHVILFDTERCFNGHFRITWEYIWDILHKIAVCRFLDLHSAEEKLSFLTHVRDSYYQGSAWAFNNGNPGTITSNPPQFEHMRHSSAQV